MAEQLTQNDGHQKDFSVTVIKHDSSDSDSVVSDSADDYPVIVDKTHRRDITSVFSYDTSTLNKGFQKELLDTFSQFQDDLHKKQELINKQKTKIKELEMESTKLNMNIKEMKKQKMDWQSKTIKSVEQMVNDKIIEELSQQFNIKSNDHDNIKNIDQLTNEIKTKYKTDKTTNSKYSNTKSSLTNYLLLFGVGLIVGYLFRDKRAQFFSSN